MGTGSAALAGLILALVAATLLTLLLRSPAPAFQTRPMEFWDTENIWLGGTGLRSWALAFDTNHAGDGGRTYRIHLETPPRPDALGWLKPDSYQPNPEIDWGRIRSVGFYLEPLGGGVSPGGTTSVRLKRATLSVPELGLEFAARGEGTVRRSELLELFRTDSRPVAAPTNGRVALNLEIVVEEDVTRLRLRALVSQNSWVTFGSIRKPINGGQPAPGRPGDYAWPMGRLSYVGSEPPMSRMDILRAWWSIDSGAAAYALLIGFPAACLGLAVWVSTRGTAGAAAAAGLAMLGAGTLYATFTPPLAAVDERRHFISLLWESDALGRLPDFTHVGMRCHANRLSYRPHERFGPDDLRRAEGYFLNPSLYGPTVIERFVPRASRRSPVTGVYWHLLGPIVREASPPHALLWLRMANLTVLGLASALGAALLVHHIGLRFSGPVLAWAFVSIAPLPYLGCIISNYPLLLASGCALAAWVAAASWNRYPGLRSCVIGGVAMGLAFHSSRNALPLLGGLGVWWLHRLATWPSLREGVPSQAALAGTLGRVYGGLAIGFLATRLLTDTRFDEDIVLSLLPAATAHATLFINLGVAGLTLALFGMEWLVTRFARPTSADRPPSQASAWPAFALAVLLAASLFVPPPRVPDIEYYSIYSLTTGLDIEVGPAEFRPTPAPVGRLAYVGNAIAGFVASLGIGHHDPFVSLSFWSGFGFFDTFLPEWAISGFCALFAGGLLALLWPWTRDVARPPRRSTLLLLAGAVAGIGLAAYACATPHDMRSLMGRYVAPVYVLFLPTLYSGWCLVTSLRRHAWIAAAVALSIHGLGLYTVLTRYL